MQSTNNRSIADSAFNRFKSAGNHIKDVKENIEKNKAGALSLTAMQDQSMLKNRLVREELPLPMALERINGVPNFQDIQILKKIIRLADTVCRITTKNRVGENGYGTGFLIAPGIMLTNHHVLPDESTAQYSFIQFNYELNSDGKPVVPITFALRPSALFLTSDVIKKESDPYSGLDFTVVAVEPISKEGKYITDFDYAKLDPTLGKILEGENCIVIQHPKGDYKKIVLKDIRMLTLAQDFLIYESDTLQGSSGSMVVGLGTGEVVALHHSGVPRKNEAGQWLKKDGSLYQHGDRDDDIDWIGNEGIRVSSIIKCLQKMPIPPNMKETYAQLELNTAEKNNLASEPSSHDSNIIQSQQIDTIVNTGKDLQLPVKINTSMQQHFYIAIVEDEKLMLDWLNHFQRIVPNAVANEAIFPNSTQSGQYNQFYLTIQSEEPIWENAAKLEALPHIELATPELPMELDTGIENKYELAYESIFAREEDYTIKNNESLFAKKWSNSLYIKNLQQEDYPYWNRHAVNFPPDFSKTMMGNLSTIKMVQIDTGYTNHPKVLGGYNLLFDQDFIDGEDAFDEASKGFLKHPAHGTRTASIIVGNMINDAVYKDGNIGLLSFKEQHTKFQIIPYRIAESVVVIEKLKNLVNAITLATDNQTDVVFMCMGTYATPVLYEAAKYAYDRGVIWVCAAGNQVEEVVAPARYPGTIAVAAINPNKEPWNGSCYGKTVDISAPGEDVYVPVTDELFGNAMIYGDGTSYATPHVAAAAALWKAKHGNELKIKYPLPWQIPEAFRYCLKASANNEGWKKNRLKDYGAGVLDIQLLLDTPLPLVTDLKYAYENMPNQQSWDLGMRETITQIWKVIVKKIKPGVGESWSGTYQNNLTARARITINALKEGSSQSLYETDNEINKKDATQILKMYLESFEQKA